MDTRKMKFPEDFPRYSQSIDPPEPPPYLPPNATEEEKAAYQVALDQRSVLRFDRVNAMLEDVGAFKARPEENEPKERSRPRMHPEIELGDLTDEEKASVTRHEVHCTVCHHPDRAIIEEEFIHWFSPRATARDHFIDVRCIYRHAHALNLFAVRSQKTRYVLGHVLERAEHIATPTADAIIRGVQTYTRITDDGHWINPPTHVVISASRAVPSASSPGQGTKTINVSDFSGSGASDPPNPPDDFRLCSTHRAEQNFAQVIENKEKSSNLHDTHSVERRKKGETRRKRAAR